ncbi:MAG: hypothetical protein P4L35_08930 [Ignavibacteriaceae bacterium]|nr:hypothetical protein [Ignavibacteriaceae bacterium]
MFTANQKEIIRWLKNREQSNSFRSFLDEYLTIKNVKYEFDEIVEPGTLRLSGINSREEITDIIKVWSYLIKYNLIDPKYIADPKAERDLPLYVSVDEGKINFTLTNMATPLWNYLFNPSLEFDEFINNDFRTKDELILDDERKRGQKSLFWAQCAVIITAIGMVISGYLNYASLQITKDNSHVLHDTVKVMYYNPPKDTAFIRTNK